MKATRIWQMTTKTLMLALCAVALVACSDGGGAEVTTPDPSTVKPLTPLISYFKVAKVDDESAAGTSLENAQTGDAVVLTWEVVNADYVELNSERGSVAKNRVDAKGRYEFVVSQSDVLTLSARNGESETVQKKVVIDVAAAAPAAEILYFEPSAATVEEGASVQLCFSVQPADAEIVTVTNSDTGESYTFETGRDLPELLPLEDGEADESASTSKMSLNLMPSTAMAAVAGSSAEVAHMPYADCTVPLTLGAGTHSFELYVSAAGAEQRATTSVEVVSIVSVDEFLVNGETAVVLDSAPNSVVLSWKVTPADATVTINGDEKETDSDGSGQAVAKIIEDTTFTLVVTDASGKTASKTVTVTIAQVAVKTVTLAVDTQSVFAGESVTFTVGGDADAVALVLPDGTKQSVTIGENSIAVTQGGGYQVVETLADGSVGAQSNAVTMTVRSWDAARGGDTKWNAVAVSTATGANQTFAGQYNAGVDMSIARVDQRNAWSVAQANFISHFHEGHGVKDYGKALERFAPFVVHDFAFDATKDEGKRVYASASGMVLYSTDAGKSWKTLIALPVIDYDKAYTSATAQHASCRGALQQGVSGKKTSLVNIKHGCAVYVDSVEGAGDRLLLGTDQGLYYVDDVDAFINGGGEGWKGSARKGDLDAGTNLLQMVVNDLVGVSGTVTTMFAATEHGVYVNAQRGEVGAWNSFNDGDLGSYDRAAKSGDAKAVYALAVDEAQDTIYAADADGSVYRASVQNGGWRSLGAVGADAQVVSMAVDQTNGALLAATTGGVYMSRDQGETWTNISASTRSDELSARSVAVAHDSTGDATYALATEQGVFVSSAPAVVEAGAADTASTEDDVEVEETPESDEESDETVVPEDGA